jgi:K+/H+ antiporter YhaU regulatory subunit KhtT
MYTFYCLIVKSDYAFNLLGVYTMNDDLKPIQDFVSNENRKTAMTNHSKVIEFTKEQIPAILQYIIVTEQYQQTEDLCKHLIPNWDNIKRHYNFTFSVTAEKKWKEN